VSAPTAKQAVLNTLNVANQVEVPLTFSDVEFGIPLPDGGTRGNTAILVTPLPNGRLAGPAWTYYYGRLQMETYLELPEPLKLDGQTTIADLLPLINAAKGLNLVIADLANPDEALPVLDVDVAEVTLRAAAGSYGWLGQVKIQIELSVLPLSMVMANTVLSGLTYEFKEEEEAEPA